MPMFSKLFEMFPDAKQFLSLSAEELAGPLLISLEGIKPINPEVLITHKNMLMEIKKNPRRLIYPAPADGDVLLALMEAWQSLLSEGFLAPIPKDLRNVTTTTYFVTRKGQKIQTLEDYKAYRKADLLRKHQLHHIIADKVWSIFAQGSYDTAILEAFKQVEVAVRDAGGYTKNDYGRGLMRKAFNVEEGNLTDQNQSKAERQARSDMFAGAIGSYKNPSSHENVEITAEEASEVIVFASHLLRLVDERRKPLGLGEPGLSNHEIP